MSQAHALVGQLAIVLGLVAAAWSVVLAIVRRPPGALFLANLVWVVVVVGIAAALGLVTALTVAPPGDPLHIVYGVIALGTLPAGAMIAAGRPAQQQARVVAVATIVLVILILRLVQTGG